MSGCTDWEVRNTIALTQGDEHAAPYALDEARENFLSEPAAPPAAGHPSEAGRAAAGRPEATGFLDPDEVFDFDEANYRPRRRLDVGFRRHGRRPLAPGLGVWAEAGLTGTMLDYDLPQGISIFTDPIDLSIRSLRADTAAGLLVRFPDLGPLETRVLAGGGVAQTELWTEVRSALLDVSDRTRLQERFFALGLEVGTGAGKPAAELALRRYSTTDYALTAGIAVPLGRGRR